MRVSAFEVQIAEGCSAIFGVWLEFMMSNLRWRESNGRSRLELRLYLSVVGLHGLELMIIGSWIRKPLDLAIKLWILIEIW